MRLDLSEIPFYASIKREYDLRTSAVLIFGAVVAFERAGVRATLLDLAYVSGIAMEKKHVREHLRALEFAGLIEVERPHAGARPSVYKLTAEGTQKLPPCARAA